MRNYAPRIPGRQTSQQRFGLFSLVIFTATWCMGCGEDWQAETHPVTGKVTVNGKAPEGAVVTLYPVGEKVDKRNSKPWGIVDGDGVFDLQTYEKADGAPVGEYVVTIKWPWDVNDMSQAMTDRLGKAYSNPDKSKWPVTIEEGENILDPIEITGAKVEMKPPSKTGGKVPGPPGPMGR